MLLNLAIGLAALGGLITIIKGLAELCMYNEKKRQLKALRASLFPKLKKEQRDPELPYLKCGGVVEPFRGGKIQHLTSMLSMIDDALKPHQNENLIKVDLTEFNKSLRRLREITVKELEEVQNGGK